MSQQNERDGTPQEKARRFGLPVIPYTPRPEEKAPVDPNPPIAVCGKCGIVLHRVMGYACLHADCPCGLGPTTCL